MPYERENHTASFGSSMAIAARYIAILQIALIILFAVCSKTTPLTADSPGTVTQGYTYFSGIEVMMFIGFGYLMTFMKDYGLGAVGLTMLVTAIGIQWYLFTESFWDQLYNTGASAPWHYVNVDIYALMDALFGVSAVLISFGAVIGKIRPGQLIVMAILELIFHAFNYKVILVGFLGVADVGGTYVDHMFGAYFGLSVSMVLKGALINGHHHDYKMGYVADLFSLIGTLFLWVYWPSFVAGAAPADSFAQERALVNTILALSASTMISFCLSTMLHPERIFRPVDIQNATLAGGVAIGCTANLNMNPVNAIFIGLAAGFVSCMGYRYLQPYLYGSINLHDTCGVHNLHGMPSIIGALASVILAGYKTTLGRDNSGDIYTEGNAQWWSQFVGICLCLICAVVTGLFTGYVLQFVDPISDKDFPFDDSTCWEVADDYKLEVWIRKNLDKVEEDAKSKKNDLKESCPVDKYNPVAQDEEKGIALQTTTTDIYM